MCEKEGPGEEEKDGSLAFSFSLKTPSFRFCFHLEIKISEWGRHGSYLG